MYLPSLAGLSLTGPSHCRPCATDKVVEYEDEEALREEGGKHLAEFSEEPGGPPEPGCAICQLPFEPGRKGGDVIILSCGHVFHLDCMANWGKEQKAKNRPVTCPLCNGHPTVAEQRELGLEIDPMEKLFETYLNGNEDGFGQIWRSLYNSFSKTFGDVSNLAYRPPYFTGDRRGMSYIEAMVHAWAREDGTSALAMPGRQKILKFILVENVSRVPIRLKLKYLDGSVEASWDEEKLVSVFARRNEGGEREDWEVQHEGWKAISKRAAADSEFKEVFALVYEAVGMVWNSFKTIDYNLFDYETLFLTKLFSRNDPQYRTYLDEWYPKAMSYKFEAPYVLASEFANELERGSVDIEKLQKLNMLLDKFGGDKVMNVVSFQRQEDGGFDQKIYSINDQFRYEKDSLEYIAFLFKVNLDNDGVKWDEFINYDDALPIEEQWTRLDTILRFDRDQASPDICRAELRRSKDMLVTKHRRAREHLEGVGPPR